MPLPMFGPAPVTSATLPSSDTSIDTYSRPSMITVLTWV
jgi:hypothetical protein